MQMHAVSTIFNSNRLAVRHSIAISRALQTNLLIIFTLVVHLVCHQNIDENRYTYAYTIRDRERETLPQALLNIPKIAAHFLLASWMVSWCREKNEFVLQTLCSATCGLFCNNLQCHHFRLLKLARECIYIINKLLSTAVWSLNAVKHQIMTSIIVCVVSFFFSLFPFLSFAIIHDKM